MAVYTNGVLYADCIKVSILCLAIDFTSDK